MRHSSAIKFPHYKRHTSGVWCHGSHMCVTFPSLLTPILRLLFTLVFNYALILLDRRNPRLPLWNTLFICNDCGFVPRKNGAFHSDILKTSGKTLHLVFFYFIQAFSLFKIVALFLNVVLLSYKMPYDILVTKSQTQFKWNVIGSELMS